MAFDKRIEEISETDLASLIDSGTPELKTLDYKRSLPGGSDEDRKEFLADISSFANAAGGHLVYGIRADAGVPVELLGVDEASDGAILRMDSLIRDGIAPRIPGVHSVAIGLSNSRTAILTRIPKSFASPHMVKFKNTSRFYSRASNGKYQLDVQEIRAAFLGSETTAAHIRDFRLERVARIRARETPVALSAGPCVVLHIIPLSAFGGARYDVIALKQNATIYQMLAPLFRDFSNNSKLNFDGLLVFDALGDQPTPGFLQLYRSGIVETVDTYLISFVEHYQHKQRIPGLSFEVRLFRSVSNYLSVLKSLGVDLPLILMLTMIDVRGYTVARRDDMGPLGGGARFDRDILMPQEVLVDSYVSNVPMAMKPVIDEIWNAADFAGSIYYEDGKWIGDDVARNRGDV